MNASQIHPPTEARMEFDEWWKTYWVPTGQPAVFDAAMKEIAENSWAAAKKAEREHRARVDNGLKLHMEYAISLQRAIDAHCRNEIAPDAECPHHAKKLNQNLSMHIPEPGDYHGIR